MDFDLRVSERARLSKLTSDWLSENDPNRAKGPKGSNTRNNPNNSRTPRSHRMKKWRPKAIKSFIEASRNHVGKDCLFVPGAHPGFPAKVVHCGRGIPAARYMCLLTHGTPKSEGMFARHLCGNGHLSCVNPAHVAWGTPGDNQSDANKHRAVGGNVQDRIHSID